MSEILYNKRLSEDFFLLKAKHGNNSVPGQFYMLRAWESYPVLSRPISVFDSDGESVTFLYKVVGEGTEIFSRLKAGDDITLFGPYGNGFPGIDGKLALVGGGVGIAPLYFAAKRFKAARTGGTVDIFLGFSGEAVLVKEFGQAADRVVVDIGGYITDKIEPEGYDCVMACGPEAMMRALYKKCAAKGAGDRLYVSMENRMACGIGACLVCSCKTSGGNKKACKDGPVFTGEAVFGI